jgi:hypothetical protein
MNSSKHKKTKQSIAIGNAGAATKEHTKKVHLFSLDS